MANALGITLPNIGRDNNFNFLRLVFAFSVAVGHAMYAKYNYSLGILFNGHIAVCGFFIISGFLITKSYVESKNIKEYFVKRCRRLLPAYCFVVLLCAFGLSAFSSLPPGEYFTSPMLWKHIVASLCFLNFLQPALPGVFMQGGGAEKRVSEINGSLWTIRIEVLFYILVPFVVLALCRLKTRKRINIALGAAYFFGFAYSQLWVFIASKFASPFLGGIRESSGYIAYFAAGIFCMINLDWIRRHQKYIIAPGVIIVVLEYIFTFNTALEFLLPAGLGVVIMFIAFNFPRLNNVGKNGDYSYGVYVFHAPLGKIFIDLGYYDLNKDAALLSCIGTVFSIAYMSWHFLEKKALRRR
ncbi:MAG: acyltransferase [Spirochaetaceae bacterium]|nr:acyltransferase [Spirochaetaceae bacterium]